jgi:prepilin-type processing-associated H-X9-DG protein
MYAGDHAGFYPPRADGGTAAAPDPRWPGRLQDGYRNVKLLVCPTDGKDPATLTTMPNVADASPRSYIFNGANDYTTNWAVKGWSLPENAIHYSSETVMFGEKKTTSQHYYMDLLEVPRANLSGNEYYELEQKRHGSGVGANYGFADGSVRYLKAWKAFNPICLWAVTEAGRTNADYIYPLPPN